MRNYLSALPFFAILVCALTIQFILTSERVNPDVFYIQQEADTPISIQTTYRPYLDPQALGGNLKSSLNRVLSFSIADPKAHINQYRDLFSSSYIGPFRKYMLEKSSVLRTQNARVVDFIITSSPVYLGSEIGYKKNWKYYVEGYFSYQGLFSGKTGISEKAALFIRLEEGGANASNPLGVVISDINGLP